MLPTPITHLSETETLMSEQVSKFARDVILPRARAMDEAETMDPVVVEHCFEQGLMGIEIPEEYGGAGMNFTAAIVGIEELARVDPSVSVMVDVHNTLVNTAVLKYGSEALRRTWLPRLATDTVGASRDLKIPAVPPFIRSMSGWPSESARRCLLTSRPKAPSVSPNRSPAPTPSRSRPKPPRPPRATESQAPRCG